MEHPISPVCILLSLLFILSDGKRPNPSSILPILELMEPEGDIYDPRPEDKDETKLKEVLGGAWDPRVMSVNMPSEFEKFPNGTVRLGLRKTGSGQMVPQGKLPKQIKRMRLQVVRMGDGKRIPLKMGNKMKRRFRDLLWLHSHCPLLQKWRDLGPRFWPRWFLENSCAPRPTCSFPKGMHCQPHSSVNKVLLRWHCQNWQSKTNCNWIRVQYPLVTECQCRC